MARKERTSSGTLYIDLQDDMSEAVSVLKGMGGDKNKMLRRMLAGIGTSAKNQARKAYKSTLSKQSGNLYKSISRTVINNGRAVKIYAKARNERYQFYGYALAQGSTILPKKTGGYLYIQKDGNILAKVKEVKLESHDFIQKPINDYLKSGAYKQQVQKLMNREIKKLQQGAKK